MNGICFVETIDVKLFLELFLCWWWSDVYITIIIEVWLSLTTKSLWKLVRFGVITNELLYAQITGGPFSVIRQHALKLFILISLFASCLVLPIIIFLSWIMLNALWSLYVLGRFLNNHLLVYARTWSWKRLVGLHQVFYLCFVLGFIYHHLAGSSIS